MSHVDPTARKAYMQQYREANQVRLQEANAARHRNNPQPMRDRSKQWRLDNPERYDANMRKAKLAKYGLTPADYDRMLAEQGNVCKLCGGVCDGVSSTGKPWALAVDHCHTTGKVRGLLCRKCNQTLGKIEDSTAWLRKAIDYLEK